MTTLVFFVEQIALGLYILIAIGVYLSWRGWSRARYDYRSTHFELERDFSRFQQANSVTVFILLIEAALIVVGVQFVVAPTVRESLTSIVNADEIIEDQPFYTPTPSFTTGGQIDASGIQISEEDPELQVLLTPTLTPTPVGTIIPNAPTFIGCDTENASLQIPANGMQVFEPMTVVGTANVEDFAFYRIELNGPGTFNNFAVYDEHLSPVTETTALGQFNPAPYETGWYEFRLMVFDISNTLRASCLVNIYITDPVPTPTPIGQT
jgi:hypothetical protein